MDKNYDGMAGDMHELLHDVECLGRGQDAHWRKTQLGNAELNG